MKTRFKLATAATALLSASLLPLQPAIAKSTADRSGESAHDSAITYFANDSVLPFHAPDFTRFDDSDYLPVFKAAMKVHKGEVERIKNNPEAPTFENTIVALETSGRMLGRVGNVFFALTGANTNDARDAIASEIGPILAAHTDSIALDPALFARVKAVYDSRASLTMNVEEAKLLEDTYEGMVHAGAMLTPEQKEQVKSINSQLSTLTTQFSQKVRQATVENALIVDTREELAGLSDAEIDSAAKLAADKGQEGKFAIALQNTTRHPLNPALENRATREKLFWNSYHRADSGDANDTRLLLAKIATLRAQKAALFGQPDWASYTMWDRMAKNPKTAIGFMEQMVPALAAAQRRDAAELNARIAADGGNFTVTPWDWNVYAEKVKAEKFAFDANQVKPYFQLDRVLEDGVFFAANKLYGLSFKRRNDIPVYHPDVRTYTVIDRNGSELGLFYFDPFQRPSKRGGAWMGNFVDQSYRYGHKPVVYNVLNIPKAPEGEVQLVDFDNVETTFHEFGHALHGLFADQQFASLSGSATARDFVEYPSQVNEVWASDPEVLRNYAQHYQTGETIPLEMVEKVQATAKFNQGYDFGETVEAALLDMKWHALSAEEAAAIDTVEKVDAFERKSLKDLGLEIDLVPPRYRSSYFNHIFSSSTGYSAGYYSYLWTEMLDKDSRKWLSDNGGLTRANGDHLRATVLSRGGTMDYFEMYRNFAGREPDVTPLLESHGLVEEGE
ncbi:MAG: M3 family peptidase [Alphaproteobacteria bacterium]|nr:MAG: M3 family peptidase [Alphaproteobacteria bacterium]